MGLLFLDPLVQVAIATTLAGCWFVWRGRLRSWFGRPDGWTVLVWPLPLVLVVTPLVVGPLRGGLALVAAAAGFPLGDTADALIFAALYLVPLIGLTLWPPRWLLPGWARARLAVPAGAAAPGQAAPSALSGPVAPSGSPASSEPAVDEDVDQDVDEDGSLLVMPACLGRRGHGSRARWVWRVDAVPGELSIAAGQARFRPDPPSGTSLPTDELGGPRSPIRPASVEDPDPGSARFETTWGRRYLDADLAAVDELRIHARRWWADDGVLTLELAGRPSAHLWITDVDRLQRALATMR